METETWVLIREHLGHCRRGRTQKHHERVNEKIAIGLYHIGFTNYMWVQNYTFSINPIG